METQIEKHWSEEPVNWLAVLTGLIRDYDGKPANIVRKITDHDYRLDNAANLMSTPIQIFIYKGEAGLMSIARDCDLHVRFRNGFSTRLEADDFEIGRHLNMRDDDTLDSFVDELRTVVSALMEADYAA